MIRPYAVTATFFANVFNRTLSPVLVPKPFVDDASERCLPPALER